MENKKPHKHAELIKAWADGVEIQCYIPKPRDVWVNTNNPSWSKDREYRLKPDVSKPEYVPFTWEDRSFIKANWIKGKTVKLECFINEVDVGDTGNLRANGFDAKYLLENFTFLNGTPCGKLK